MSAILRARGLHVSLGGREILRGVDLDFEAGRIHGVLGPNGCGKTTLLRVLSGAAQPDAGQVLLDGQPVSGMSASQVARKLAVVWQGSHPVGDVTVRRLVGHGRYARLPWWSMRAPGNDAAVDKAMRLTGVEELRDRRVETLSGGERQRVWIAAALAQEPDVLLLDEPTTYLDIAHQIDVLELVDRLNREQGITVVAVLHDLTQAARYCHRCSVLGQGRVQREGAPAEALSRQAIRADFSVDSWVTTDPLINRPAIQPRHRCPSSVTEPTTKEVAS